MSLKNRVVCADCIAGMFDMFEPGSLDLIVADPPYNIGIDYGGGSAADRMPSEEYANWCKSWIFMAVSRLRNGGSLWVVSGQEHGADSDIAIQRSGMIMRNRITWHETFGVYCHNKFGRTSRPIYYAVKPGGDFTFNADSVRVPSARQAKYRDRRANPRGKIMGDVWTISRVCGTFGERVDGFPTQLPYELVSRIVGCSSNEGDTILDPFAGSGTTLLAAARMGRIGYGIEKSREYTRLANERLEADSAVA